MEYEGKGSLRWRVKGTFRALSISLAISSLGTAVDAILLLMTGSIILMTDLLHWTVDTVLEAVFLLITYLAGRISQRFPWSIVVIEALAVSLGTLAIITVYSYFFFEYLRSIAETASVSYSGFLPVVATAVGCALTLVMYRVQSKNYRRYRTELIKFDSTHALLDTVAAVVATTGIILTTHTGSYIVELLFVFILHLFVVHSLVGVFKDNVKTILGINRDARLEVEVYSRLRDLVIPKAKVRSVAARRFGSLCIVEVSLDVEPDATVLELHKMRRRVVETVREVSDLVYHVDVTFHPSYTKRSIGRVARRRQKRGES